MSASPEAYPPLARFSIRKEKTLRTHAWWTNAQILKTQSTPRSYAQVTTYHFWRVGP